MDFAHGIALSDGWTDRHKVGSSSFVVIQFGGEGGLRSSVIPDQPLTLRFSLGHVLNAVLAGT